MAFLIGLSLSAWAQGSQETPQTQTGFPPEAQPIQAGALKERLAGHAFKVALRDGSGWRLLFKGDFIYVNTSAGANDSGAWRTEDNKLCIVYQRFPSGCNEMQASDKTLYLKRPANAEVVRFDPND